MAKTDPNAIINPSTGLFARNPTHINEAMRADDQTAIAKAVKGTGRALQHVRLTYEDPKNPEAMPGIYHIRGMRSDEVEALCKSLLRWKPNIFMLDLCYGDYPNMVEVHHPKVQALSGNAPRFHTDVAVVLAEVISDRTLNIVRVRYQVTNTEPGRYTAVASAWQTTADAYVNDKYFNPTVDIDFFPNQ